MFAIPLVKAFRADLPDPPPTLSEPLDLSLPAEDGAPVTLASLRGRLVVVSEVPLANEPEAHAAIDELFALQKRLRGLGDAVHQLVLAHGGSADDLAALLEARVMRKPGITALIDGDRAGATALREAAGSRTAAFLLLDRHGRVRGAYAGDEQARDRLVADTGLLANWRGADRAP